MLDSNITKLLFLAFGLLIVLALVVKAPEIRAAFDNGVNALQGNRIQGL